jgi:hypothetical protein
MTDTTNNKRFKSGREVFETYIPGYIAPRNLFNEEPFEVSQTKTATEVSASLLSSLKSELDRLELQRTHSI